MTSLVEKYLQANPGTAPRAKLHNIHYINSLELLSQDNPDLAKSILHELVAQRSKLKLIASENYSSISSQAAMGNLLTDKYAEGVVGKRFYGACQQVDEVEALASAAAKELFGAQNAYVQPHSGADANLIAFWAILNTKLENKFLEALKIKNLYDLSAEDWAELRSQLGNQRLLGLDIYSGGHLTHGYRYNVSGRMFESYSYTVDEKTGLIDYDKLAEQAQELRPLILLAGYSAYPRLLDFERMRRIADSVGAVLMTDMAHFAGLLAGGALEGVHNPIAYSDIVTSTTHKTLRGPRGGLILCTDEYAQSVGKGCPLVIGGPLAHVMGAKAVAFKEAASAEFKEYARRVIENAQALAQACMAEGLQLVSSGTDNHLLLIDLRAASINGRQAERALEESNISVNRNTLFNDPNGAWYTSAIRLGTPAVTSLGMTTADMSSIAKIIALVIHNTRPSLIKEGKLQGKLSKNKYDLAAGVGAQAKSLCHELISKYPVYPDLDLDFLTANLL